MSVKFIQLRDHGCSGVWDVFMRAREIYKGAAPHKIGGSAEMSLQNAGIADKALWLEALAAVDCSVAVGAALLISDAEYSQQLAEERSVLNAGNAMAMPLAVLADLLVTAEVKEEPQTENICISVIGNADGIWGGMVNSWLEACLCFHNQLFLAFPENHLPDANMLDFALNAGGKIFMSYDPAMVLDDVSAFVAIPGYLARHPLSMLPEIDNQLIFSYVDAWQPEKSDAAAKKACMISFLEFINAKVSAQAE